MADDSDFILNGADDEGVDMLHGAAADVDGHPYDDEPAEEDALDHW